MVKMFQASQSLQNYLTNRDFFTHQHKPLHTREPFAGLFRGQGLQALLGLCEVPSRECLTDLRETGNGRLAQRRQVFIQLV